MPPKRHAIRLGNVLGIVTGGSWQVIEIQGCCERYDDNTNTMNLRRGLRKRGNLANVITRNLGSCQMVFDATIGPSLVMR